MNIVSVVRVPDGQYPQKAPYHPSEQYPEYPFSGFIDTTVNEIYAAVRKSFYLLGYDSEHWGTKSWNPLGYLIKPGMTVVLKPNFVLSHHKEGGNLFSIITHPSVLRAVADYCWIALCGQGRIIIADSPQYDCDFKRLLNATHVDQIADFYNKLKKVRADVYDLRDYWSRGKHFASMLEPLPGDPRGSICVNLGKDSALYGKPHPDKLYGAVYHRKETISHHSDEAHVYALSKTIMDADVVISIPKMKVHKKVGVTLNAKGLVGISTNKNYLVHYSLTPPSHGGDQYPDGLFNPMEEAIIKTERWMYEHLLAPRHRILEYVHRLIYALHNNTTRRLGIKVQEAKRLLDAGNWYGNDTAWRMTVDLLTAFYFADIEGHLKMTPQRKMFSVIDGIVGGENLGPLTPDPVFSGVLVAGENLLAVDIVATRLMGYDPLKIRVFRSALEEGLHDFGVRRIDDIRVTCENPLWSNCLFDTSNRFLDYKPHPGWIGHVEIEPKAAAL